MKQLDKMLSRSGLQSIGQNNAVVKTIKNQEDIDELFKFFFHPERLIVMRAADTIEKITIVNPQYLLKHKINMEELCNIAKDKEP